MKKVLFMFLAVGVLSFASCASTENSVEDTAEEVGDEVEDAADEVEDEIDR
ncbi:hypothetical protein [Pontibacter harenae]|uniref:hypothetical protein n=1 Tax=Pontibacter harenae TaxID=2894083 RepID=UPI001E374BA2|nr:hypothetical protein [Pontibacter harenae]MCC9168263.1 hypothetical protein [Pontibacter harenae]